MQLFGDLLGTYGDNGNTLVLAKRAAWREIAATQTLVRTGDAIPDDGNLYVIGGGEDGPQTEATRQIAQSGALHRAIQNGAAVLAVCAGFQILGHTFCGAQGETLEGLGILDVNSQRSSGERIVGDIVTRAHSELNLGLFTGYENHAGITVLGSDAKPLATVQSGVGNSPDTTTEGAWQGRVIGTYMHGPVLARNPALADQLLAWALDTTPEAFAPLDDSRIEALRHDRLNAARQPTPSTKQGLRGTVRQAGRSVLRGR